MKPKTIKLIDENVGEKSLWLLVKQRILNQSTIYKKIDKYFFKIKTFVLWKTKNEELQTRRKYLQIEYLTKNVYPQYMKNIQNSLIRKQTAQ